MKILVINSLYPPYNRGGAEVVVQTVVNALKNDHDVHVCTVQPGKGVSSLRMNTAIQDGVTVHRFFPLNLFSFITIDRRPFWMRAIWHAIDALNVHSYFAIRSLAKKLQPDLVFIHNVKGIGYTTYRAVRGFKTIVEMHDVQMIEPSGLIMWNNNAILQKPSLFKQASIFLARHIVGSPDRIIFPSRFLKELYEKYGFFKHSKREVLANPVPDSFFSNGTQDKTLHRPCRFLVSGQVAEHKGIRILVEALALIPQFDCEVTVIGDGQLFEYLKDAASKDSRIKVLGRVDYSQVRPVFEQTDYTIVPSLCYENSPMAIYDSLSTGAPVIAARIGGVAELITDGVNGYTVNPGDPHDLARAMKEAARNADYTRYFQAARLSVQDSAVSKYLTRLLA